MRDLIVLTAFSVVLGTLLIQGLTLGRLLRALDLRDGDPVAEELRAARERILQAALGTVPGGVSHAEDAVRKAFTIRLATGSGDALRADKLATYQGAHRTALRTARRALLDLRDRGDIGDDAFHELEDELDWMEVSGPMRGATADETSEGR
jgi:CPA1 family monovalent cation:H+ antiporter